MKIKYIVALMTVIATAGGCTQDTGEQPEEAVPIRLAATIAPTDAGKTRAFGVWGGAATTQDTELLKDETVRAWISENEAGHTAAIKNPIEYKVADPSTADAPGDLEPVNTTTDPPFYYPIGVNSISIHAIHPSGYASGDKFTVNLDQTTEANYAASDLCYSMPTNFSRTDVDANGRKLLQMKHLLSKIVVNLTLDANVTGATLPTSIKLHANTSTTMTYPVAVTTDANGYTGCTASDASDPGVITMKQEAIIPPQTIAAGASFISFSVTGLGPMIYPMPAETTFESGKRYTYNIRVKNVGISVTTDVTDWGTKNAEQILIGKQWDIKRNPLWYVAESNLNQDGNSFSTINSTSQGYLWRYNNSTGFFQPSLGITYNTTGYNGWYAIGKTIDGESYHLPTQLEWASITPAIWSNTIFSSSYPASGTVVTEIPCTFGYNNDTKYGVGNTSNPATPTGTAFQSYWSSYTANSNLRYAIRFLGTDYCSVWKYQFVDYNTTSARLVISSKLINTINAGDNDALVAMMSTITDASYNWTNDESRGAVQRVFYACGYRLSNDGPAPGTYEGNMIRGTYACSTPYTGNFIYFFNFANNYLHIQNSAERNYQAQPVRLFRDN